MAVEDGDPQFGPLAGSPRSLLFRRAPRLTEGPSSSRDLCFSSHSSHPPGSIQAGDWESQPTSRSQSQALAPSPALTRAEGRLGSSPSLSAKEGLETRSPPQAAGCGSPSFPPYLEGLTSTGRARIAVGGALSAPLPLGWAPSASVWSSFHARPSSACVWPHVPCWNLFLGGRLGAWEELEMRGQKTCVLFPLLPPTSWVILSVWASVSPSVVARPAGPS